MKDAGLLQPFPFPIFISKEQVLLPIDVLLAMFKQAAIPLG